MLRSIYQWTATTSLTCTTFSSIWFAISIILINCGPGDTAKSVSLLLQIFHNWRSIRTSKEPPTHTFLGRPRIIYRRSIPRQNITQPGADHCKGLLMLHLNTAATLTHQNDNEALWTTLQWYQYQFLSRSQRSKSLTKEIFAVQVLCTPCITSTSSIDWRCPNTEKYTERLLT